MDAITFVDMSLNRFFLLGLIIVSLMGAGCNGSKTNLPESEAIPVTIKIARFEKDFFAVDTAQIDAQLTKLAFRYPVFFPSFLNAIVGINPADPQAAEAIKAFLKSYRPVYNSAQIRVEKALPEMANQLKKALQWLHYLVPAYQPDSPFVITTFIGPMDAYESFSIGDYGDVRTDNGVGVALQFHLGADDPVYENGLSSGMLYQYQVRRFTPETMVVNAMKNIIEDLFPYTFAGKPLVEEMVEKGKRLYLLQKVLPDVDDSLLIGYTGTQLQGCKENEALIWQFFVKNELLFSIDPSFNQSYIKDGPKTPELGENAPGNIGLFTGWQIVNTYMDQNEDMSISDMMNLPATKIFQASGYKPK